MKKLILTLVLLTGLVWLSGCKPKIPEPVDEATMKADLPEELRTVTIDGETWRVQDTILEVGERNTDLDHQTDDISCRVTLTGEGFSVSYPCDLHYAYVRSSGWGLRSGELTGEPELTLEERACMSDITRENQLKLRQELGYDTVGLLFEDWDDARDCYQQTYSVNKETNYLSESGTVQLSGGLKRQGNLNYVWQTDPDQVTTQTQVKLEGTVWHFASEEERVEAAFRVTAQDGTTLTLSGVFRVENWAGNIKEKPLETQVEYQVSSFDCITFALPNISGKKSECNIQSDRQWVNLDGLFLGNLEAAEMPESGNLSDLMVLDLESWLDKLPSGETEEPEIPEIPEVPQVPGEKEESSDPVGSLIQGAQDLWDYITGLFGG